MRCYWNDFMFIHRSILIIIVKILLLLILILVIIIIVILFLFAVFNMFWLLCVSLQIFWRLRA